MIQLTATIHECDLDTVLAITYQMRVLMRAFHTYTSRSAQMWYFAKTISHRWRRAHTEADIVKDIQHGGAWVMTDFTKAVPLGECCSFYTAHFCVDLRRDGVYLNYYYRNKPTRRGVDRLHSVIAVLSPYVDAVQVGAWEWGKDDDNEPIYEWTRLQRSPVR